MNFSCWSWMTRVPIPAAASVLASLWIFDHHILQLGKEVKPVLILISTFILAFLMVSTIKYTKFKGMKLQAGEGFMYLVWGVLGIMLIVAAPQIALFVLFAGYAVSGVVMLLLSLLRRTVRRGPSAERLPEESKD